MSNDFWVGLFITIWVVLWDDNPDLLDAIIVRVIGGQAQYELYKETNK